MRLFNCKVQASPNFSLHAWSRKVDSQNIIIVLTTFVCAWKLQNPIFLQSFEFQSFKREFLEPN
jgi:hypothetical protein